MIKAPRLPKPAEQKAPDLVFSSGADECDVLISDSDLSNQQIEDLTLERISLCKVQMNQCMIDRLRLTDARLEKVDLSNVEWVDTKINRAEIIDCKLTGFCLVNSSVANVLFENCQGELIQLHGTKFRSTVFKNCKMHKADFRHTELTEAVFDNCDLAQAEFYGANMTGCDLRGSRLEDMKINAEDLKGAIIDPQQLLELAPLFANLLHVQVQKR